MRCICILSMVLSGVAAGADLFVSPDGNDANPGTREKPFATLSHARDAVREKVRAGLTGPITVEVAGGTYRQTEPLVFGLSDSGTDAHAVTYVAAPQARPVFSGGRKLTGWKVLADGTWELELPDVRNGSLTFRQLFVGGERRPRARHPNDGYLRVVKVGADRRTNFQFKAGDLPDGVDWRCAELVFLHDWSISRVPVKSVDQATKTLTTDGNVGPSAKHYAMDHFEKQPRYFVENAAALLDTPGEWYLDVTSGVLRYKPLPGETPEKTEVVAPVASCLLRVEGDLTDGKPVKNLHFRGLSFEHCAWTFPGRYAAGQACFHEELGANGGLRVPLPAAVQFTCTENCSLQDGHVAHTGGSGVWVGARCRGNLVGGMHVYDIGGNGVLVGEDRTRTVGDKPWWQSAPKQVATENRVENNLIERCGRQFYGAIGVWVGLTRGTRLSHNEIRFLPYTGVSVGWLWSPDRTPCAENVVEFNHIHDIMQELSDGGGIYTLGRQPGTRLHGNLIHDVPVNMGRAESNGMFLDEGTTDLTISENVIYGIARSPLRFHKATKNRVCDNLLYVGKGISHIRFNNTKPEHIKDERNAVRQGAPPAAVPGIRGRAMAFAGGQSVTVPHAEALEPEALTVEGWVKLARMPAGTDSRTWVVGKNSNEWENGHYGLLANGTGAVGAYLNIGGQKENNFSAMSDEGMIAADTWRHLAFAYDGKVLRVHLDGREVARKEVGRKRAKGSGPLVIGARPDGHTHFVGAIDEMALYRRALTAEEIQQRFEARGEAPSPALKEVQSMAWSFEDAVKLDPRIEAAKEQAGPSPPHRARFGLE